MTTMTRPPERSLQQRRDALARATEVRQRRARLKHELLAGTRDIQGLLLDPPDYLLTARVFDIVMAVPKYGRVKVNKILRLCDVSATRTFGQLTDRQRHDLSKMIRGGLCAPRRLDTPAPDIRVQSRLVAFYGMQPAAASALLRRLQISPSRRPSQLTPRQQLQLGAAIDELVRASRRATAAR